MKTIHIDKIANYETSNVTALSRYLAVENDEGALFTLVPDHSDGDIDIATILCGSVFRYYDGGERKEDRFGSRAKRLLLVAAENGKAELLRKRHEGVNSAQVMTAVLSLDGWLVAGMNAEVTQPELDEDFRGPGLLWFTVVLK